MGDESDTAGRGDEHERSDSFSAARERAAGDAPPAGGLSDADVYSLLLHQYRRYPFYYLEAADGEGTITDLVEFIAVNGETADGRERIRNDLRAHLSKLAEFDLLEYSFDADSVTLLPGVEQVEPHLELAAEAENVDYP